MPYSHLHRLAKEKLESSTHCLGDLASLDRPDSDFSELVWENGQILMQGQSNKSRKSSGVTLQRKEEEHLPPSFKPTHSVLSDFPSSVPSSRHMGMGQDDELVHWLNYPLDDYSSEFFSEFNQNAFSMQNTAVPVLKNNGSGGANSEQGNMAKLVREGPEITRIKGSQQGSSPRVQNFQESLPSHRSRVQDSTGCDTNNAQQVRAGHLTQNQPSTSRPPKSKVQQQEPEPTQPSSNTGFMNFSHFLRPATSVKTNLQSGDGALGSSSSGRDRFRTNDKVSVVSGSNHMQSTLIESANGSRSLTGYENKQNSLPAKTELKPAIGKPPKEPFCIEQSQPDCREDALGKGRSPDQAFGQTSSFAASTAAGGTDNEKCVEPVVASSSVCSGSSAKEASNDVKHRFKRKFRDTEESDYPSEDVEEESVGLRKPTSARGGTSIKRSRAAEVHNLSERKRRDRINEKMRALQELIPNCNKVDKASMLDEAIEYLKTLQLQVQIMSMGTGLFMPPMMLPNGMQHMSAPHLPPYASMNAGMGLGMGLGMGMGMGFGMGMLDMNGGSSGYPLMQVPPMHGGHFSYPPISAPPSLPMMPGSSLPMFGTAGQGIPMQTPCAPSVPLSGPLSKCAPSPVVPGAAIPVEVPNLAVPSSSKDPTEDINIQLPKRVADCSENPMASQVTKEGADQSAAEQRHDQDQPSQSGGNGVMDST